MLQGYVYIFISLRRRIFSPPEEEQDKFFQVFLYDALDIYPWVPSASTGYKFPVILLSLRNDGNFKAWSNFQ